jgi:hypothetical protein
VHTHKSHNPNLHKNFHKIDLDQDYPCPCRRRGRLVPITLTEAFGCNRCQQIFEVDPQGQTLEKLSTSYPKQLWRWSGHHWVAVGQGWRDSYTTMALGITLVLLSIWLPVALNSSSKSSMVIWTVVALLVAVLPALVVLLAYRR